MPNKSFSIYRTDEYRVEEGDLVVVEIANSHLACVVTEGHKKGIRACEVFSFDPAESNDTNYLLDQIIQASKILALPLTSITVFVNNECCVPVPIFQFSRDLAVEYLNLVFGEEPTSKIQFEHLPVEPGIMNVYRVRQHLFDTLQNRFKNCTFHHTYSNILKTRLADAEVLIPELINVQFYNTFFIVTVLKAGKLQLIQTYVYETPEDVLYYLLNICQQLDLDNESLVVQISGMIDVHFKLYRELITYFKKVQVQSVDQTKTLPPAAEYPIHYFTPYFNLAL